jgi:hypothetical protein
MNDRVADEARKLVRLPKNVQVWKVVDIGEAHRVDDKAREQYEEEIYREIVDKLDKMFPTT